MRQSDDFNEDSREDDSEDERFMSRALALARRGLYTTDPNPRVGCVLVRDGKVVEQGPADAIFQQPRQDYTRELIAAAFDLEGARGVPRRPATRHSSRSSGR